MNSPWFIDSALATQAKHSNSDDACDRVFRAVLEALDKTCDADDSAADVLQGLSEATALLYVLLLDENKAGSPSEAREAFLTWMGGAYDLVCTVHKLMA